MERKEKNKIPSSRRKKKILKKKKKNNILYIILFVLIFLLILLLIFIGVLSFVSKPESLTLSNNIEQQSRNKSADVNVSQVNKDIPSSIIDVKVNPPVELNYKSKEEIYEIRKSYVKESPFYYEGYFPSDGPFGQIESGYPWISVYACQDRETRKTNIEGLAEESRFINNPTALIMVVYPYAEYWCDSVPPDAKFEFWPKSISYDSNNKIVRVRYSELKPQGDRFYLFNGLNARDFGYNYAYLDLEKSNFTPEFVNQSNFSNQVAEIQDFLHRGGSCGHESGCNNGSPLQELLQFVNTHSEEQILSNRELYIKLWKEPPSSPDAPADIVEILSFDRI